MAKKIFTLLLAVCFVFIIAACSNSEAPSSEDPSGDPSTDSADISETAESCSAVLLASINPQIKMYLSDSGVVLAVEAANGDAEQIVDGILTEGADYKTVIKAFISAANSKGFIKDGATIEFEIAEQNDDRLNAENVLAEAAIAAENAAAELNIALEVINNDINNESEPADETNPGTESDGTEQSEAHTHIYSEATCTEAAECSCGATNGSALGHSWEPATCKAPKTCKTCGATEGGKGDHSYVNGTCTVCGTASALNPKTDLSSSEYVGNLNVSGDMLIGAALQFDGEACVVVERYFNSVQTDPNQTPVVFEGKNYYSEGGGQDPHYYELTDTEILVKGSFWGEDPDTVTIRLVLQADGMLTVTYSVDERFPVGTVLSTDINDVLK